MIFRVGNLAPQPTWDWGLPLRLSKSDSGGGENPPSQRILQQQGGKIASS